MNWLSVIHSNNCDITIVCIMMSVTHYPDTTLLTICEGKHWWSVNSHHRCPLMRKYWNFHYSDAIMGAMASLITVVSIVYSCVCSGADQRKHQSSTLLAFVRGIHRWPMNSPHKGPVTRKMFPFDDVIMSMRSVIRYTVSVATGFISLDLYK